MGGLSISITNFSDVQWTLSQWHCETGTSGHLGDNDVITNTPSQILLANSGATTAAAHQIDLQPITQDALWMMLIYADPNGNQFGVHVNQNFQEFSIGPGDDWGYWGTKGNWHDEKENSAPVTLTTPTGITIQMTPTLGHQSASVNVVISPPAPSR